MRDIPRLSWVAARLAKSSTGKRKNRPGEKSAHHEASVENASRSFTREVDKALEVPPGAELNDPLGLEERR